MSNYKTLQRRLSFLLEQLQETVRALNWNSHQSKNRENEFGCGIKRAQIQAAFEQAGIQIINNDENAVDRYERRRSESASDETTTASSPPPARTQIRPAVDRVHGTS